jgi:hypothetical protein
MREIQQFLQDSGFGHLVCLYIQAILGLEDLLRDEFKAGD